MQRVQSLIAFYLLMFASCVWAQNGVGPRPGAEPNHGSDWLAGLGLGAFLIFAIVAAFVMTPLILGWLRNRDRRSAPPRPTS